MTAPFTPLVAPPASPSGPALWFAFQGTQLLIRRDSDRAFVPRMEHPRELGLEPLRIQYLGTLAAEHCFACEVAGDVGAPQGML